ncbi:MAG: ATP-binding cassette domain-containing protein [Rhodomicrobium sp.]
MLQVENLSVPGLAPVSFSLQTGECVAIRGPSGAGKTLLLRAIADLDPNSGNVRLDGVDRSALPAPLWRQRVGYLPAEPGWWADRIGEHFSGWSGALALVQRLGLPADAKDWPVARASTGERARLALARALMAAPQVLLLDEPTAALDAASVVAAEALIAERVRGGLSVLWVTHDAAQAGRVAKRGLLVEAGEVREARAA